MPALPTATWDVTDHPAETPVRCRLRRQTQRMLASANLAHAAGNVFVERLARHYYRKLRHLRFEHLDAHIATVIGPNMYGPALDDVAKQARWARAHPMPWAERGL